MGRLRAASVPCGGFVLGTAAAGRGRTAVPRAARASSRGWFEGPGVVFRHENLWLHCILGRNIPAAQGSRCCSAGGGSVTPHAWRVRACLSVCRLPSICLFTRLCFSGEQEVCLTEPGHQRAFSAAGAEPGAGRWGLETTRVSADIYANEMFFCCTGPSGNGSVGLNIDIYWCASGEK